MEQHQKSEIENSKLTVPLWRQLRWNLILFFVLLAVVPVTLAITFTLYQGRVQATEQVKSQLTSIAELKRGQLTRWVEASKGVLTLFLADKNRADQLVNFAVFSSTGDRTVTQNTLNNLLGDAVKAQPLFQDFFLYNTKGEILAASKPADIGKVVTRQPYFAQSLTAPYVQPPYYALGTADLAMLITQPLIDQRGRIVGVLAGRLNLDTLSQIMTDRVGLGNSGETYLVSLESKYFVTSSRFEDQGYIKVHSYSSDGIDRALSGEEGSDIYGDYRTPRVTVIGAYRWLPELQVGLLAEIDEAEALATYTQAQNFSILIALFAVVAAAGVGLYSATRIAKPITALTQVATQIAGGDLEQRAEIKERNEIGLLAATFNTMTDQLRELIGSLEERIAARTRRLEIAATLGERVSALLNFEELLRVVVNQVKDNFHYYHAHIYILDDKDERLVMTEGTGSAGAEMKAKGHSIPLNAPTSLVARAARTAQIIRVDNVREVVDWLPNPLLPDTYSEMAVPIILEGQVAGVLDVQQDKIAGLDEGDANLLRSLANQVAVAIRNARQFAEVETALAEARAAQERYLKQAWEEIRVAPQDTYYHYQQSGSLPLSSETQSQTALEAPIRLQNQTIGVIQLHDPERAHPWSERELALVDAVTEQIAQVAENIRLFEETRQRAGREQSIREITDKLRAAPNLDALLETAARELGQRLGVRHTVLELGIEAAKVSPTNGAANKNGIEVGG